MQALSPGKGGAMGMWGGGQQEGDEEATRRLCEVVADLLAVPREGDGWQRDGLWEVARRNARMVAAWQVWGFMHGVINTDK